MGVLNFRKYIPHYFGAYYFECLPGVILFDQLIEKLF